MAAALTLAQAELISSLSQDEIPIKLRCAICSRLAVNAFRLPCCEQAICDSCQSSLPSSCPVCEHTPVAAEDCKPNKSLRTTIKVFLRTEEKKREDRRLKDIKNSPVVNQETPTEPVEPARIPTIPLELAPAPPSELKDEEPTIELPVPNKQHKIVSENNVAGGEILLEDEKDIPQPSIEEIAPGQEQTEDGNTNVDRRGAGDVEAADYQLGQIEMTEKDSNGQSIMMPGMQSLVFGGGLGFDSTGAGGFPNMAAMGQGGDFNQMQMMMAMQNGMMPNAFGAFPMMGMPGMTMDPMAMQSMYMNGGFGAQGMGMNGMNMGMGIAGFDGGIGAGFNNGWNGQRSWNVGQDNFNHPNAAGMSHGDFGANNSAFQPSAGYNQGNYGRANHYNDYQQNGYGHQNQGQYFRGRGRGRGYGYGAGRGGHGNGYNDAFSQQLPHGLQNGSTVGPMSDTSIPTGPKADSVSSAPPATSNVDEFGREIREKSKVLEDTEPKAAPANDVVAIETTEEQTSSKENGDKELSTNVQGDELKPIQTIDQLETTNVAQINAIPTAPTGPSGRGGFHGNFIDRSVTRSMGPPHIPALTPKPLDIPINAPTGPKAMREGLPNTSLVNLRGRGGYPTVGRGGVRLNGSHIEPPLTSVRSRSESPEKENESAGTRDRDHTRSPSIDRERDRDRRSEKHKRRHRHRSTSESEDETDRDRRSDKHRRRHRHRSTSRSDDEEERRRERRRRRERKHGDDVNENDKDEALSTESRTNGEDVERSRSQSPAESRRSSHRSRRDRERERDRDRDKDRERDKDRSHRSSHRSHRDRSRDRDRERSPERDRDRHRRRHNSVEARDKDRDMGAESQPSAPVEERKKEIKIPSGPRAMSMTNGTNGIEIKGASARGQSIHGAEEKEKSSRTTSHTEERESKDRDRERERERDRDRDAERSRDHRRESRANGPESSVSSLNAKPAIDPHTLEREARNRERLLKEAQRMAGLAASAAGGGRKRSRDEGVLGGGDDGRKGRKHRRSDREADEERIARLENERESSRWA